MATAQQLALSFLGVRNSELFSNHWLEHRLVLEDEWETAKPQATAVLDKLVAIRKVQRTRVAHYGTEQALEEAFIQPVLRVLGWELNYQTFLRGRKPDYALFLTNEAYDSALRAGPRTPEYWEHPALLADAKAWDRPLARPSVVNNQREYPPEQIEWYLNNSLQDYAILTNGRLWRLVPRQHEPGQRRFQTDLECDLPRLLDDRLRLLEEHETQTGRLFETWSGVRGLPPVLPVLFAHRVPGGGGRSAAAHTSGTGGEQRVSPWRRRRTEAAGVRRAEPPEPRDPRLPHAHGGLHVTGIHAHAPEFVGPRPSLFCEVPAGPVEVGLADDELTGFDPVGERHWVIVA